MKAFTILAALFAAFLAVPAQALIVGVDFNQTGVGANQSGFNAFNAPSSGNTTPLSQTFGTLTTTIVGPAYTGNFNAGGFTNSGEFTYAALLNDFAYNGFDGGSLDFELSGSAIKPSTTYTITVWAVDPNGTNDGNTLTVSPTGGSGTLGTPGSIFYTTVTAPTSNFDYSTTVNFTSNGSGLIDFSVLGAGNISERVNGFQITLPEPASAGLLVLCLGPMFARRRRTV